MIVKDGVRDAVGGRSSSEAVEAGRYELIAEFTLSLLSKKHL